MFRRRRWILLAIIVVSILGGLLPVLSAQPRNTNTDPIKQLLKPSLFGHRFQWRDIAQRYPVHSFRPLPTGKSVSIPKIQFDFPKDEDEERREQRLQRLGAVKEAFSHSWRGYREHAWLHDELRPVSGNWSDPFGGWGATLVDSLDTLWIMGMKREFHEAVAAVSNIDFRSVDAYQISVFKTTIRFLGGLLGAYDVSGHKYKVLLRKAIELGDMLYMAFDTPNRLPVTHWDWKGAMLGVEQIPSSHSSIAELGSLSLEFTRLSQLTNDQKWYDAVARITDHLAESQNQTYMPGLWPTYVNAIAANFKSDFTFTLGGMADSVYEYLPKAHLLLGGQIDEYQNMYASALRAMKEYLFFRPLHNHGRKMLIPGTVKRHPIGSLKRYTTSDHLSCFVGGMVALAAKAFEQPAELETAEELLEGCIWAAESVRTGITPEAFAVLGCQAQEPDKCLWNEDHWLRTLAEQALKQGKTSVANVEAGRRTAEENGLPPGFIEISDSRYILRPEVIESVFVLYRITGDQRLYEKAWEMFERVHSATRTAIGYAAIKHVNREPLEYIDSMESFWTAETLKYFFLIFSDPETVSLDEYVL